MKNYDAPPRAAYVFDNGLRSQPAVWCEVLLFHKRLARGGGGWLRRLLTMREFMC